MEIDKEHIMCIIKEELENILKEESLNKPIERRVSLENLPSAFDPSIPTDAKVLFSIPAKNTPEADFIKEKKKFNSWWRALSISTRWLMQKWLSDHLKPPINYDLILDKVSKTMAASKGLDPNSPKDPNEKPK